MTAKLARLRNLQDASAGKSLDDYPLALRVHHLAEIYGVSLKQMYARIGHGEFDLVELTPKTRPRTWSRELVRAHFNGTLATMAPAQMRLVRGGRR